MTELAGVSDAPPPPPPPLSPEDTGRTTPDVTAELASALTDDGQRSSAPGSRPEPTGDATVDQVPQGSEPDTPAPQTQDLPEVPDAPDRIQEPERGGVDSRVADLPQPEASAELRSALADGPDTTQAGPVEAEPTQGSDASQVRAGDGDAPAGTDTPAVGRPDVAALYPADYVPSSDPPAAVEAPHESPEAWAADVNQDRDAAGRDNNCGECARAVDDTWNGDPAAAAAMSDPDSSGEPVARMTDWAGQAPTPASMSDIQQRLDDLGPGSSAVVGCDWNDGGGHWFNAVNDEGSVTAVDGQTGLVEDWPPSKGGLGYDEGRMRNSDAIFFTADGKVVGQ